MFQLTSFLRKTVSVNTKQSNVRVHTSSEIFFGNYTVRGISVDIADIRFPLEVIIQALQI